MVNWDWLHFQVLRGCLGCLDLVDWQFSIFGKSSVLVRFKTTLFNWLFRMLVLKLWQFKDSLLHRDDFLWKTRILIVFTIILIVLYDLHFLTSPDNVGFFNLNFNRMPHTSILILFHHSSWGKWLIWIVFAADTLHSVPWSFIGIFFCSALPSITILWSLCC